MKNIFILCSIASTFQLFAQKRTEPKLIVSIVVDQMCYDYLYRFKYRFGKNGFNKLMDQGMNCRNTRYNYVPTYTGPGHASIYTGSTPSNHGIVANDWFDRYTRQIVNCVDDSTVRAVGSDSKEGWCSPHHLKTTTVGDQLKLTYPDAKVISVSIKDRGAILPGGHLSDGSYWFDYSYGEFITSSFFKSTLPDWVLKFNEQDYPQKALSSKWTTLYDVATYKESGPDNSPYEQLLPEKQTPTFPYDLSLMQKSSKDFSLFTYTPFANSALTDLAISGLLAEKLGSDDQSDLLCISYSTPDLVGHAFGPFSVELEDIYLRLDQDLARLISFLEKQIGKKEFVLMLTADHGVAPVPQQLVDKKLPGGYFFSSQYLPDLRKKLNQKFGVDPIRQVVNCNIYLDYDLIKTTRYELSEVRSFISDEVAKWEEVKAVYTSEQLSGITEGDSWFMMIRNGYHKDESGDVIFLLESGYLPKTEDMPSSHVGTSHGSAFNYDTHVPLLFYGKGIEKGELFRKINITDIAPTLSCFLKIQRTGSMTGEPIEELFK